TAPPARCRGRGARCARRGSTRATSRGGWCRCRHRRCPGRRGRGRGARASRAGLERAGSFSGRQSYHALRAPELCRKRACGAAAYFVRFALAVTLALITPALFSRPPDPLPHWEKRETVGVGRAARAFNVSSLSNVARCAQRTLRMPFSPSPDAGGRAGGGGGGGGARGCGEIVSVPRGQGRGKQPPRTRQL